MLPCSLPYYYKRKGIDVCDCIQTMIFYFVSLSCFIPSLIICLLFEFFHFLGWFFSCFCCFRRFNCKCKNIKSDSTGVDHIDLNPPYDHQKILNNLNWSNKFFLFYFYFFYFLFYFIFLIFYKKRCLCRKCGRRN